MLAIIRTGGKQYRVAKGDVVTIEKLPVEEGEHVTFGDVLLVKKQRTVQVGNPMVKGAQVTGKVMEQGRGKKIVIRKYKPKKRMRKKQGHRQNYTTVKITGIMTEK